MDFLSRLLSGPYAPNKNAPRSTAHDPQARLLRFKRVWNQILELCNRPRNPETEKPLFDQLHHTLDRLAGLIRDESRAPMPHVCLSYASGNHIYAQLSRAAAVSQHEPIIHSTISIFAALVDSEEEDFLSSSPFAKSLMRLVKRVIDGPNTLVGVETETAILELLFTIAAKIRLQPSILPVWFQSSSRPTIEDDAVDDEKKNEKKKFIGAAQKDDFPLCYLLIDRVHHEGRLGDFARTGLLYIFEATGRSSSLEEWVMLSDLPTLMASGLGALYSQLSRELSILHPDSILPAVLAMSDYSTTHPRATAESAFSPRHESHMATFLSYLAFWQDILDHCRSVEVKQSLVDHFQVLFLQQLLYPSLLQSSDTDAGSSVAVLTYMNAMLEALDYQDLVHMMLVYLLNAKFEDISASTASLRPFEDPPSPTSLKRKQSLALRETLQAGEDVVEPALFSLVDLLLNSIGSRNNQTSFAALRLASTLVTRQRPYALGTIIKCDSIDGDRRLRTVGLVETEIELYSKLTLAGNVDDVSGAYSLLAEDIQTIFETQVPWQKPSFTDVEPTRNAQINSRLLTLDDPLLQGVLRRLRHFLTNSVDVNLAITQAITSIATSVEIRLDGWLALDSSHVPSVNKDQIIRHPWQKYLGEEEMQRWFEVKRAGQRDPTAEDHAPLVYQILSKVKGELDHVQKTVSNFEQLLQSRRDLIQGTSMDSASSRPGTQREPSQSSAKPVTIRAKSIATDQSIHASLRRNESRPSTSRSASYRGTMSASRTPLSNIFQPPPPEAPSTTDVLMQEISFAAGRTAAEAKSVSLNHILTNTVILEDFIREIVAILQVRAAVLGSAEVCLRIV